MKRSGLTKTFIPRGWFAVVSVAAVTALTLVLREALVEHGKNKIQQLTLSEADRIYSEISGKISAQIFALRRMADAWEVRHGLPAKKEGQPVGTPPDFSGHAAIQWLDEALRTQWIVPWSEKDQGIDFADPAWQKEILATVRERRKLKLARIIPPPTRSENFLICVPLYGKKAAGGTLVITGLFRLEDLLDSLIADNLQRGFCVAVVDRGAEIYRRCEIPVDSPSRWVHDLSLDLPGVSWYVRVWPAPALVSRTKSELADAALGGGLLIAVLLAITLYYAEKSRLKQADAAAARQSLGQEISERKRAQESRLQLAAIVESSDDAIIGADLNGRIRNWNRGAQSLCGYTTAEIDGQPIALLFAPDARQEIDSAVLRVKNGGGDERLETEWLKKGGALINVALTLSPIRSADGAVTGTSVIARDITERKKADELLKQQAEELARSNQELEAFAYMASHDLQAPLQKILSFSELVIQQNGDRLDGQSRDYLHRVLRSTVRMGELIKDLLAYSKASKSTEPFAPVSLDEAVQEAVADLEVHIKELNARIEIDSLPQILGDKVQMRRLFQNLIGNALKFHKQGEPPEVLIKHRLLGSGFHEITVEDHGIGFDTSHAERIFEPFQRLHTRDAYEGTGLGLAICQKIVHRHGGRISATSQPGQKTVFLIHLPAQVPQASPAAHPR